MALPKLESRITIPTGGLVATVGDTGNSGTPVAQTAVAGDYYLAGTTSLLSHLKSVWDASLCAGTFTFSVDDNGDSSTGKVTISSTETFSVTWTSTVLRNMLGFTGNLSAASTYTATNASPYIWLPNCGRSGVRGPEPASTSYDMGALESDYRLAVSPSGYTVALTYNTRLVDTMNFANLKGYKTWKQHEVVVNESLQKFIETILTDGGVPFKFFPDRSSDSVAWQWAFAEGFNGFQPTPVVDGWVGAQSLWSVAYNVRKKI